MTKRVVYSVIVISFFWANLFAQKNTHWENLTIHQVSYPPVNFNFSETEKATANLPKYSGKSRNEQLKLVSDSMIAKNQKLMYANGYRLLVYSGNDKVKAMESRKIVLTKFPSANVYLIYHQPDWRIKVGDFDNRLEIQKIYTELLADFPNALIVPDQIYISTDKPAAKLTEEPIIEVK